MIMYHQGGSFKHKVEMQLFSKFKEIVEQVQSHLNFSKLTVLKIPIDFERKETIRIFEW